jgi:hypothetical protein
MKGYTSRPLVSTIIYSFVTAYTYADAVDMNEVHPFRTQLH